MSLIVNNFGSLFLSNLLSCSSLIFRTNQSLLNTKFSFVQTLMKYFFSYEPYNFGRYSISWMFLVILGSNTLKIFLIFESDFTII